MIPYVFFDPYILEPIMSTVKPPICRPFTKPSTSWASLSINSWNCRQYYLDSLRFNAHSIKIIQNPREVLWLTDCLTGLLTRCER